MLPFVGPTYNLKTGKASVARTVNMFLTGLETPSKSQFIGAHDVATLRKVDV